MNNRLDIGDIKAIKYQKTIVVIGFLFMVLFGVIALISNNVYYKFFPIITFVFFAIIIGIYSRVYSISCDKHSFFVRSLFRKRIIDKKNFLEIRKVPFLDFILIVVFKDVKFLVLRTSESYFKNLFRSTSLTAHELTEEIKAYIND